MKDLERFVQYRGMNAEFNALGEARRVDTHEPLHWLYAKNRRRINVFIPLNEKTAGKNNFLKRDLRRIIADLFVPKQEGQENHVCVLKNGNPLDVRASNLEWKSKEEVYSHWRDFFIKSTIEEFKIPELDPDEDSWANLKECPSKPGYYFLPFIRTYLVVNKEGKIYDLVNEKFKKLRTDSLGYVNLNIPWGKEQGSSKSMYKHHRLMAMTFIEKPDDLKKYSFSELQVNHKDGNKTNNSLSNLEWVTHQGNIDHAVATGLYKNGKPVLEKNILTNKIKIHRTVDSLLRHLRLEYPTLSETTLRMNLKLGWLSVIPINNLLYKLDDGKPWPVTAPPENCNKSMLSYRTLVVRDVINETDYFFDTIDKFCQRFGLIKDSYKNKMYRSRGRRPFKGFITVPYEEFKQRYF